MSNRSSVRFALHEKPDLSLSDVETQSTESNKSIKHELGLI